MSEPYCFVIDGQMDRSWPVPASLAQVIRETCVEGGRPHLIPPASADLTMYAVDAGEGDYTLHLGSPDVSGQPVPPSWGVYLAKHEVDVADPEAVKEWVSAELGDDADEIDLDEPIDGDTYDQWLFWDYDLNESPMAQAYRYLEGLPLVGVGHDCGTVLGNLDFVEGASPGSNLTYVTAPDLASLACLQERLKELNQKVRIEIYPNA
jgi:hypothetical protein